MKLDIQLLYCVIITLNCIYIVSTDMAGEAMMRAVQFEKGGYEKMSVGTVPRPSPTEKQVLIKVFSTAINRADTLQRKGLYPPPPGESDILGLEAAGLVESLGPGCSSKWKIGDRVMALLGGGGNAEFVAAREELLMPIPRNLNWTEAGAIPEVWLTAYQLLQIGKLERDETVLIHGGGSGVGTAAVQLVALRGGRSIVTAGSQAKLDRAKSLGASAAFNYKEGEFSQKVLEATGGKGVDVILDCIGGSFSEQNSNCIAMEGRWVLYGLLGGGDSTPGFLGKLLRKRVTLTATTLRARKIEYKNSLIKSFSENALPHFETGNLKPIVFTTFPLEQISEAHKMMEENKNNGKIVIKVVPDDKPKDEL